MNAAPFCVFDFETAGKNPNTCVPLFVAAKVFGARSLEQVPGGAFNSLMKPKPGELEALDPKEVKESLEINKIKPDDFAVAPEREHVWRQFVAFLKRFGKGNVFNAPIPCGINIKAFDLVIVERLCRETGNVDKEGRANIFNRRFTIDLLDTCFLWWESDKEVTAYNMDYIRDKFGIPKGEAHQANFVDVDHEATFVLKFLRLHRHFTQRVTWPWKNRPEAATAA